MGWTLKGNIKGPSGAATGDLIGVTYLTAGLNYVDVVFTAPMTNDKWTFVELRIYNTVDVTTLNIWPGIVVSKTAAGFRLLLNAVPSTPNYRLSWIVRPPVAAVTTATTFQMNSATAAGPIGQPAAFTVQLNSGETVSGTVTVTPNDGGAGGTFSPTSVTLTTAAPFASFTYTPASAGAKTVGVTNTGGLTNPPALTYTAS